MTVDTAAEYEIRGLERLPSHMHGGIKRWILNGIPAGSFLNSVLRNDLMGALGKADEMNKHALFEYGMFLYNDAPSGCYGSLDECVEWAMHSGLSNIQRDESNRQTIKDMLR